MLRRTDITTPCKKLGDSHQARYRAELVSGILRELIKTESMAATLTAG
jgi:hypothetical protein